MSTLGKVLLFLNFLAAAGLAYLTVQDWSKRQQINGGILRYHLALQGLPIEATKVDSDDTDTVAIQLKTATGPSVQILRKPLLNAHFAGTPGGDVFGGGGSVTSLMEELNRVEPKLQTQIDQNQGNAGKLDFLAGKLTKNGFEPGLLMKLAESYEERAAVKALVYPPPKDAAIDANLAEAKKRLAGKIAALKSAPAPAQLQAMATKITELKDKIVKDPKDEASKAELAAISAQGAPPFTRDDADRRRRIAQFLMLLDPSAAWQKRVIMVTGLKTYQVALNEQVGRLADIARQTERIIESDQASFEADYDLTKRLAIKQDSLVTEHTRLVTALTEMEALDLASRNARATQLTNLKNDLAKLQAEIAAVLKKQADSEKAVFDLQRKVGDALKGNLELEAKLDQTEQPKP